MKKLVLALSVLPILACGGENPPPAPPPPPATTEPPPPPPPEPPPAPPPAKPSMSEMQKTTLLALQAAFNAHDAAKMASYYATDAVDALPAPDGGWKETNGRDAIQKREAEFFSKVDPHMTYVRVFQKGDVAIAEWVGGGMEKDNPQSKKVGFRAGSVYWFDGDGLVKKVHMYVDETTIAMQLGKMPGKARDVVAMPTGDPQWIAGSADDNKSVDLVKANWPTTFPKKDKKAWEASVTDDYFHEEIAMPLDWKGKADATKEYDMLTKAVPDMSINVDNAWGFADQVALEFTFKGTQKGQLGPIKPTNKPFVMHGLEIDTFKDGKLQKATTYTNGMEIAGQLGLLPKPKAEPKKDDKKPAAPTPPAPKK